MKVLSIGTDRGIFDAASTVRKRMVQYAACFGELHVIVFSTKQSGFKKTQIAENAWVYPTQSFSRLLYIFDAIRIAENIQCDVVTTQDPFETGYVGMKVSKKKNIPLHVQVHTDFLSAGFQKHSFLNRIRFVLSEKVIAHAARIRVVSAALRERIVHRFQPQAEISVLPIYIDIERYKNIERVPHEKVELLFVGRLESEKRPYWALAALEHVRNEGVDAHLTFVGDGSLKKGLMEQGREHVSFAGHTDPLPYYAQADMLLVPSVYEGYGMVMVEASAAGISVVATDVGVAEEVGAYIAPHTIDGFAESVSSALSSNYVPEPFSYLYENEEAYVQQWCEDVKKTVI
jgi:glycosyltransferase involved in cell wall biosynthesis